MSKLFSLMLALSLTFSSLSFSEETKDHPSISDIISNIMAGDNAYKSYKTIVQNEKSVCIDKTRKYLNKPVDKKSFYQAWNMNCIVMNNSQLCSGLKKEDQLLCDQPAKTKWYSNVWEKTKACGKGIYKSWEDYMKFISSIGQYLMNSEIEIEEKGGKKKKVKLRDHTNSQVSETYASIKSYFALEMTKHQDKYKVGRKRAFLAVSGGLLDKFMKGLNKMIAKAAPKVGCYNYKAKTRVICQVLAEFIAEPILMFKFIKLGPKALKGTRVAKFFKFHKANTTRKIANKSNKVLDKVNAISKKSHNIDFIPTDSKAAIKILENNNLLESVATNKKVFNDIFPDKKSLDELHDYLSLTSKQEADDLAQVLKVLNEDRSKMTPQQYKSYIEDVKAGIRKSCGI